MINQKKKDPFQQYFTISNLFGQNFDSIHPLLKRTKLKRNKWGLQIEN